jgi:hypothetical protein
MLTLYYLEKLPTSALAIERRVRSRIGAGPSLGSLIGGRTSLPPLLHGNFSASAVRKS